MTTEDDSQTPDTIIVIRCMDKDVARLRNMIHATAETQDVVFRERPSKHNFGVDLYKVISAGLDTLFQQAKENRRG